MPFAARHQVPMVARGRTLSARGRMPAARRAAGGTPGEKARRVQRGAGQRIGEASADARTAALGLRSQAAAHRARGRRRWAEKGRGWLGLTADAGQRFGKAGATGAEVSVALVDTGECRSRGRVKFCGPASGMRRPGAQAAACGGAAGRQVVVA